jgi:hypothetical protein
MKIASPRVRITESSTEFSVMMTIIREFSGAKRTIMLHSFFVAHMTDLVKAALANHVEGTQEYYNVLQHVGTSQSAYMEIFDHNPQQYTTKGLDLVRDFRCILDLEYHTRKMCAVIGLEGFDIEPPTTLCTTFFSDINHLGFNVKVIGVAERAAMSRPGK